MARLVLCQFDVTPAHTKAVTHDQQQLAVQHARNLDLPDSALIALAAIDAFAYGARRNDWITLPPRTVDAFGRGFRWWHRATSKLEEAGLIECQPHAVRLPRYRLKKVGPGASRKA